MRVAADDLTLRHGQVMGLMVCAPSVIKPAKPRPRMRATTFASSAFFAATVRRTPPATGSVLADNRRHAVELGGVGHDHGPNRLLRTSGAGDLHGESRR